MYDRFTLGIELGNEAMQNAADVARALRKAADQLEKGSIARAIMDMNGNKVGNFELA